MIFLCFHDLFICSPIISLIREIPFFTLQIPSPLCTDTFSPLLDFIPQSQQSDKIPLPTVHNNV